jgi:hypothetical protein
MKPWRRRAIKLKAFLPRSSEGRSRRPGSAQEGSGSSFANDALSIYRHIAEIRHRHMKCQEYLFCARLLGQADGGKRPSDLERILLQLES